MAHVSDSDDQAQDVGDLFPGTIVLKNGRYILERCTSGEPEYILDLSNDQQKSQIDALIKNNTKFWVNILGLYDEINDEHHLKVQDILDIQSGQSCTWIDFLESLEQA